MPAPSITEEEHLNIWKQMKTNHLDRYQLQHMDSRGDELVFKVTVKKEAEQRRVSLPAALAQESSPLKVSNRRMSIVQDPYYSTDTTSFFSNNKHKQVSTGRRYSVAASQINANSLYQTDESPNTPPKSILDNTRRDVVIKDDGIILYGDLKKKKLSDSITWQVPIYEEIIIERITGNGKLYYCNYSSSDKLKKIYDSASLSEEGSLTCNTKFLQLHNSSTYYFKFVKYHSQDIITFSYRNKYSL